MDAIIQDILEKVACGKTLNEVCEEGRDYGYPAPSTFRLWVLNDTPPGITAQYNKSRELQWDFWADQIADDSSNCRIGEQTETDATGNVVKVKTGDAVERSRLAIDSKKWLLSKLLPKRYGERVQNEITGKDGTPLVITWNNGA